MDWIAAGAWALPAMTNAGAKVEQRCRHRAGGRPGRRAAAVAGRRDRRPQAALWHGGGGLPRGRITVLAAARTGATGRLTVLQALAAAASTSMQVAYVDLAGTLDPGFLADLGADLDACVVVRPPARPGVAPGVRDDALLRAPARSGEEASIAAGLAMARSLVVAGIPWLAIALGRVAPPRRDLAVDHALAALAAVVEARGVVACIAAGVPLMAPLAYASSLTLACAPLGWQEAHGDVVGLRVGVRVEKSKISTPGGAMSLLLRYPRPQSAAEVVGLPAVVRPGAGVAPAWVDPPAAAQVAAAR